MAEKAYPAPIENYYGAPILVVNEEGTATLELENYSGTDNVVVSPEFAAAWIKEFGDAEA